MNKDNIQIPDDFRGLIYEPGSEQEVVSLFFLLLPYLELDLCFDELRTDFPDCLAWKKTTKGWQEVKIEFEHLSQNFVIHNHDINRCDILVCWKHNWNSCPLEVIELSKEVRKFDNRFVLLDKPKYSQAIWDRQKFLDYVEKENPYLINYHRRVLTILDDNSIYIVEGKGPKVPTYNFKIPSTDNRAVAIIQADGKICIDFSKLAGDEKKRLSTKLKERLELEFDDNKSWPIVGQFGNDIKESKINEFIDVLLSSK